MGWSSYNAQNYKENGKIDVKKECDSLIADDWTLLKSGMVGTTYYGAVQNGKNVIAVIILTSTSKCDGLNFGYKFMNETYGPAEAKCPQGILNLLTETDNEYANDWRKRCWEYHKKPKLNKLKVGQKIKFQIGSQEIVLIKRSPAFQFKTPWWQIEGSSTYYKKNRIPQNWELVE